MSESSSNCQWATGLPGLGELVSGMAQPCGLREGRRRTLCPSVFLCKA